MRTTAYTNIEERDAMIRDQLRARGLDDEVVLAAMRAVDRRAFVPTAESEKAYADSAHPIELGQTISQPYMVALSTSVACIQRGDRVLEIGTGSGYQAAVLAQLAREVITVERHPLLAQKAAITLQEQGIKNVQVVEGDGTRGSPEHAPFDAIVVTAGAPEVPKALVDQLRVGGRLVIPVGPRAMQRLVAVQKLSSTEARTTDHGPCVYVPLIGEQGWPKD